MRLSPPWTSASGFEERAEQESMHFNKAVKSLKDSIVCKVILLQCDCRKHWNWALFF